MKRPILLSIALLLGIGCYGQKLAPLDTKEKELSIEALRDSIHKIDRPGASEEIQRARVRSLVEIAWNYIHLAKYDSSISVGYRALKLAEKHELVGEYPLIYNNLIYSLQDIDEYERSYEFIQRYRALPKDVRDEGPDFFDNILSYVNWKYPKDSAYAFLSGHVTDALKEGDTISNVLSISNLATVEYNLNHSDKADSLYSIFWKYRFNTDPHLWPTFYSVRGLLKADLGFPDLGLKYEDTAKILAIEQNVPEVLENVYRARVWMHILKEDYRSAYEDQKNYMAYSDSMHDFKQVELLEELNTQYETEKKERMIEQQDSKLKQAGIIRNALFGALAGIVIIAFLFLRNYNQQRRIAEQKLELSHKKVDDLMRDQRIQSIEAMLKGQEEERQRLARELHDRLGGMLSTVKLQFSGIGDRNEVANDNGFMKAVTMLDEASREVRRISHDLASGGLEKLGLIHTLEQLQETIEDSGRIKMELSVFNLDQRLDIELETEIYRIIQELVSNTLKHAKAQNISLNLTRSENHLNVIFEDDGKGFDPSNVKPGKGLGLANIPQRVERVGGTVSIDSSPGNGATFIIDVPLG